MPFFGRSVPCQVSCSMPETEQNEQDTKGSGPVHRGDIASIESKQIAKSRQAQRVDVGVDLPGAFLSDSGFNFVPLASRSENRRIRSSPQQASGVLHCTGPSRGPQSSKLGRGVVRIISFLVLLKGRTSRRLPGCPRDYGYVCFTLKSERL